MFISPSAACLQRALVGEQVANVILFCLSPLFYFSLFPPLGLFRGVQWYLLFKQPHGRVHLGTQRLKTYAIVNTFFCLLLHMFLFPFGT